MSADDPPPPEPSKWRAVSFQFDGKLPDGVQEKSLVDLIGEWDTEPRVSITIHKVTVLAVAPKESGSRVTLLMTPGAQLHLRLAEERKPKWKVHVHPKATKDT
jgi:hypothetical protein